MHDLYFHVYNYVERFYVPIGIQNSWRTLGHTSFEECFRPLKYAHDHLFHLVISVLYVYNNTCV